MSVHWLTTSLIFTLGLLSGFTAKANPPWPFPWAAACKVDWPAMEGQYVLSEETTSLYMERVRIALSEQNGYRMLQVSRYDLQGQLTYDGYTVLAPNQKTVRLSLNAVGTQAPPIRATIEFHYESEKAECGEGHLVPIMTLELPKHRFFEYKLTRVPGS